MWDRKDLSSFYMSKQLWKFFMHLWFGFLWWSRKMLRCRRMFFWIVTMPGQEFRLDGVLNWYFQPVTPKYHWIHSKVEIWNKMREYNWIVWMRLYRRLWEKVCFFENLIMNQFENFLSIVELDDDTSTRRCIDVDECKQDIVTCNNFNEECVNNEGSFKCVCKVRK